MIHITGAIALEEREVEESFVRAAGPGGQNVNKVATAVQLRFDVRRSPSLPEDVRARLVKLAGRKLTQEGVLVITAQRYRTQDRNRQDALERLVALIRRAVVRPAPRRRTKPPPAPGGGAWPPRAAALASRSCGRLPRPSSRTPDPPRTLARSSDGATALRIPSISGVDKILLSLRFS
jgi:ribosome-associated protein